MVTNARTHVGSPQGTTSCQQGEAAVGGTRTCITRRGGCLCLCHEGNTESCREGEGGEGGPRGRKEWESPPPPPPPTQMHTQAQAQAQAQHTHKHKHKHTHTHKHTHKHKHKRTSRACPALGGWSGREGGHARLCSCTTPAPPPARPRPPRCSGRRAVAPQPPRSRGLRKETRDERREARGERRAT